MNKKEFAKQMAWITRDKYKGNPDSISPNDIKRLKAGIPLDYIIGWKPFLNCEIELSQKPLIPRPETEYWVEKFLLFTSRDKKTVSVLDIFSGSGCVGIAVLKNLENSKVDFAEINNDFIKQIKINLKKNKINSKRFRVIKSDSFKNVSDKYNFILANPPYIPTRSNLLERNVRSNEPAQALFGGKDGLYFIKIILKDSKKHLKRGGSVWIEFDHPQKKEIEKLLLKDSDYKSFNFFRDQYKKWRFVVVST